MMKIRTAAVLFLAFPALGLAPASRAGEAAFAATELAEHILLVSGPSGNTLVAADTDGLVLIDGVPAQAAQAYLDFVTAETGQDRIKTLVNTHWHHERSGLNALAAEAGAQIVAQENTRLWLGATIRLRGEEILHEPVPAQALPGKTFHDSESLPFRGGAIELGHLLQAHTDGDLYAYFPAANILYTGDVLRSNGWSVVDEATNGFIGGLMDALAELEGLIDENTLIVPGSGPVMNKAGFDAQHAMYKDLMAKMVALLRDSRSAAEVVVLDPTAGLRPEWGDASDFLDQGFRSFYGHLRDARHTGGGMP